MEDSENREFLVVLVCSVFPGQPRPILAQKVYEQHPGAKNGDGSGEGGLYKHQKKAEQREDKERLRADILKTMSRGGLLPR